MVETPGIVTYVVQNTQPLAAFVRHLRDLHQTQIKEYQCTCGFSSHNFMDVATHKRYCQGLAPTTKKHTCSYCKFSSDSDTRLRVYIARIHSKQHNVNLKETKVFQWMEVQLEFLAEMVIDLKPKKTPKLNLVLVKLMDQGEQAIQKDKIGI